MKEFIEKLIGRLVEEVNFYDGVDIGARQVTKIVNQLAEEYKHCALCYLGSPCEYQNENAMLPNELLADNNGWIPVSERLPVEDTYVLCQGKQGMLIAYIDSFDNEWRDRHLYRRTNIKAWQPLPAPYTENKVSEMTTDWKQNVMEKFERVD